MVISTNTLKDGTNKRIRYYSCANFRRKGSSVCSANSVRADDAEGYRITREDAVKVIELVNDTVAVSDSKADAKAILRTFIDKITFNKKTKRNTKST